MLRFKKLNCNKILKMTLGMILGTALFLTNFGNDSKVYANELTLEDYLNTFPSEYRIEVRASVFYDMNTLFRGWDNPLLGKIIENRDCYTVIDVEADPDYVEIGRGPDYINWRYIKSGDNVTVYLTAAVDCVHINHNGSTHIKGSIEKYPFKAKVNLQYPEANEKGEVSTTAPCSHSYEWEVTKQATATQDGESVSRCKYCGEIQNNTRSTVSGYSIFTEETIKAIQNASDKEVIIETNLWESFPVTVLQELSDKKDVSLTIRYKYQGNYYTLTIPAGSDLSTIIKENLFVGFRYLDSIFGGSQIIK